MKKILTPISFVLSFLLSICYNTLVGQDTIHLSNPSFEDEPHKGQRGAPGIKSWIDCGLGCFPSESPPDIHPVKGNAWNVSMQPYDGDTYLGLVVRATRSWESVSQQLNIPLRTGVCYSFSAMLSQVHIYQSPTIATIKAGNNSKESFVHPAILVIWGGQDQCHKQEILAQSHDVANNDWQAYEFILKPRNNYSHITIEAYYSKSSMAPYNGHIMIDNLSAIIEVECK